MTTQVTFKIGQAYQANGGGPLHSITVPKAGLTAAEVVELASLDRIGTDRLTSRQKERLDGLRLRRRQFGLADMKATLTEARGAADYHRGYMLTNGFCGKNPDNYCNHYPSMDDAAYFELVKQAAATMDKLLEAIAAGRSGAAEAAAFRSAIKAVALETEPVRVRRNELDSKQDAKRMENYERISRQIWWHGTKKYRVRRQRFGALWVQFEEIGTKKRHWNFLPECGPRASYRPVKATSAAA